MMRPPAVHSYYWGRRYPVYELGKLHGRAGNETGFRREVVKALELAAQVIHLRKGRPCEEGAGGGVTMLGVVASGP